MLNLYSNNYYYLLYIYLFILKDKKLLNEKNLKLLKKNKSLDLKKEINLIISKYGNNISYQNTIDLIDKNRLEYLFSILNLVNINILRNIVLYIFYLSQKEEEQINNFEIIIYNFAFKNNIFESRDDIIPYINKSNDDLIYKSLILSLFNSKEQIKIFNLLFNNFLAVIDSIKEPYIIIYYIIMNYNPIQIFDLFKCICPELNNIIISSDYKIKKVKILFNKDDEDEDEDEDEDKLKNKFKSNIFKLVSQLTDKSSISTELFRESIYIKYIKYFNKRNLLKYVNKSTLQLKDYEDIEKEITDEDEEDDYDKEGNDEIIIPKNFKRLDIEKLKNLAISLYKTTPKEKINSMDKETLETLINIKYNKQEGKYVEDEDEDEYEENTIVEKYEVIVNKLYMMKLSIIYYIKYFLIRYYKIIIINKHDKILLGQMLNKIKYMVQTKNYGTPQYAEYFTFLLDNKYNTNIFVNELLIILQKTYNNSNKLFLDKDENIFYNFEDIITKIINSIILLYIETDNSFINRRRFITSESTSRKDSILLEDLHREEDPVYFYNTIRIIDDKYIETLSFSEKILFSIKLIKKRFKELKTEYEICKFFNFCYEIIIEIKKLKGNIYRDIFYSSLLKTLKESKLEESNSKILKTFNEIKEHFSKLEKEERRRLSPIKEDSESKIYIPLDPNKQLSSRALRNYRIPLDE